MKRINEEGERELERQVPNWVRAVRDSRGNGNSVMLMLDAFAGEPELLYNALWFAHSLGVEVILTSAQAD